MMNMVLVILDVLAFVILFREYFSKKFGKKGNSIQSREI